MPELVEQLVENPQKLLTEFAEQCLDELAVSTGRGEEFRKNILAKTTRIEMDDIFVPFGNIIYQSSFLGLKVKQTHPCALRLLVAQLLRPSHRQVTPWKLMCSYCSIREAPCSTILVIDIDLEMLHLLQHHFVLNVVHIGDILIYIYIFFVNTHVRRV